MNTQRGGVPAEYKGRRSCKENGTNEAYELTGDSKAYARETVPDRDAGQQMTMDAGFTMPESQSEIKAGETSALISRISDTSQALTNKAHVAANCAVRTAIAAKSTIDTIERVVKCMREITSAMNDVAESVEKLERHSRDIDNVVVVVDEITKRTNMVTRNYTQKAGKANDKEQRSSLVSKDIKQVAKLINEEAQVTTDCLHILRTDINECVKATGFAVKRIETGYKTANEASGAMNRVMDSVEDVSEQIDSIFEAAEQVSDSSTDMRRVVDNVVREVNSSSEKLAKMSCELHDYIALFQSYREIADPEESEQWTLQRI
jgi:methyl-accepting chemotaxis protein